MLDTIVSIINKYTGGLSRYDLYSVEVFRVDVEDVIYLINSKDGDYAIYETDYILSLDKILDTLKNTAEENGYKFIGAQSLKNSNMEDIIFVSENLRYKYVLATIEANNRSQRIDPISYGNR